MVYFEFDSVLTTYTGVVPMKTICYLLKDLHYRVKIHYHVYK